MVLPTSSSSQKLSVLSLRHSKEIEEIFFNSGLGDRAQHFFASFHSQLARSADDAMATTNFLRFLESSFNQTTLLRDLDDHPILLETLLLIFGSSQYFSDTLIRDPELFRWLTATNILESARTMEDFRDTARQSIEPFQTAARKINVLKRFQRRETLRIGVRDLLRLAGVETTTFELSHIADTIVALSAELTMGEMRLQYGVEPETPWAILGLGKLGGEELNYSSDIDLIALFESDGEMLTKAGVKMTYGEFFVRFVERLAETLASPTEEGYFYRVDLRLRPDGKSGALIRTFASTMMYYESRGELWERQMLIKARPVAGSEGFARKFLDAITPFVYPRTFFRNPIEEISHIKSRIESDAGEHNIKLRAGGIRDIEFIVQALQLVNGGKTPAIRNANTLAALALLQTHSILSETETGELREAYVFFRELEHRLQMLEYVQTHSIPGGKRDRKKLAVRMGLTHDEFEYKLRSHQHNVRRIFNSVFTKEGASQSAVDRFMTEKPDSEFSRAYAGRFRLENIENAVRLLRRLMYGTNVLGKKEYPERTRTLFRKIAEPLLEEIAFSAAPDFALSHCERILSSFTVPDTMYSLCTERNFRTAFIKLCAESAMLSNRFALSPDLAETILTGINGVMNEGAAPPPPASGIHQWKNREESKAAVRYILGDRKEESLFRSLSDIADRSLSLLFESERKALKLPASLRFCILGLGKLGGHEIGFGSDLDVIFLYQTHKKAEEEKCEKLATRIMTACSRTVGAGKLYDIDARLRPEGRNAPIAVAGEQYLEYLLHRASLWERQSLTRARFVAGNEEFSEGLLKSIHKIVYSAALPKNWTREIHSMRLKTQTRSRTAAADYIDIKLGDGGMMDAEFAVQALQLSRHFDANPSTNMYELLDAFSDDALLGQHVSDLGRNYRFYRRIEVALQLGLDMKGHVVPADERSLSYLSRLLKYSSGQDLRSAVRARLTETRMAFEAMLHSLA